MLDRRRAGRLRLALAALIIPVQLLSVPRSVAARPAATRPVTLTSLHMISPMTGWGLTTRAVLRTHNGGRTWRVVYRYTGPTEYMGTAFSAQGATRAELVVPVKPNHFPPLSAVLVTRDAGKHWQRSNVVQGWAGSASDLSWISPSRGWMLAGEGAAAGSAATTLYGTVDGGLHWRLLSYNSIRTHSPHALQQCDGFDGIAFRSVRVGWATGSCGAAPQSLMFERTSDGGRTWYQQHLSSPDGRRPTAWTVWPPTFRGPDGVLPTLSSACFCLTLYTTRDGGSHWTPSAPVSVRVPQYPDIVALDPARVWVWVSNLGRLYATGDGGRHWRRLSSMRGAPPYVSIDFVDPRHGFGYPPMGRGPYPYLFITHDGGRTWHRQQSRTVNGTTTP
jgi:photosystem II stability/assembly factor-like uncharacterized protein